MSETYLYYDHSKNMLILNSGDFEVKNHITFKDNDKCKFTGNYNSMTNNPLLGTNYIYNNTITPTGIAAGQLRFNNSTIENSSQITFHKTDSLGNNLTNLLQQYYASSNDKKGIVHLHEFYDYKNGVIFTVTGLGSNKTDYVTLEIESVIIL